MKQDKKRDFQSFHNEQNDLPSQTNPKKISNDSIIPTSGSEAVSDIVAKILSLQFWPQMEASLRRVVREEFDSKFKSHFHFLPPITSPSNIQINNDHKKETIKFELCFLNQIAPTIFTNNEIETRNGDALQVALIDANNFNAIVSDGPLSMAQIEVVVLDGDSDEFINQNILSQRDGKRPLIVGNDLKLHLKNGVGFIKSLSFTDNSSWVRSKQFRLGLRIVNEKILGKLPSIKEAVSQKFRVLDHRGEVNKKHHPPQREDEVWRLEGIGRNGVYHKILASEGIKTVDDLLKTNIEKGPLYLTKLLGKNVSNKMRNALECVTRNVDPLDNFDPCFEMQDLFGYEGMGSQGFEGNLEVSEQRNSKDWNKFLETTFKEWEPMQEASISYNYNNEVQDANACPTNTTNK